MVSDSKVINSILAAVTLVLILLSFHQAAAKTDYSTDPIITILPYDAIARRYQSSLCDYR